MKTELKDISVTRKAIVINLDASEVAAEYNSVVAEFTKFAKLPGFRPGKAPAAMIIKQHGKSIETEFKQQLVAKAYRKGLEETKADPLNIISVEDGNPTPDKAATITVTIDVPPAFTLPDYNGIPTTIKPTDVSDQEVETAIEQLRAQRADFKVATRPAQKSDYVKLAYEGFIDGKSISEIAPDKQIYAKVPQTWEEVEGANDGLLPGLGKQLAGLSTGDKKTVTITFPAEMSAAPALAGKTATYNLEIQEIRERSLPEINEEFLKANNAETLDALKTQIKDNLQRRKDYENKQSQRRQVTEALVGMVDFPVPDSLVEGETQNVLRNFIEENMRRGAKPEDFEKDKKALYESAQKAAATRAKTRLILARIAEQEKVKVENSDIEQYIFQEAMMTRTAPEKFAKQLAKDQDQLRNIQRSIILEKTIDLLVEKSKPTAA